MKKFLRKQSRNLATERVMTMSNSSLVNYIRISPNSNNPRNKPITKITPHHMAGKLSVETCGNVFAPVSRKASANYSIDSDGRVGMYVEEKNRAWTSSSAANDHQAVTIEVANDRIGGDWHVSDKALAKLIELCVDICRRNDIPKLVYTGDATGNLTRHNMFTATSCPGPYLQSKFPYIAEEVNKRLNAGAVPPAGSGTLYYVQTGAFAKKANADVQLAKVKTAGFDAIMKKSGNLYRVQVGAYAQKPNADAMAAKLKAAGFDTYVTIAGGTQVSASSAPAAPVPTIKVGSKVKIKSSASKYSTGQAIPNWVKANTYTVQQLGKGKALLKEIVSWVNTSDLTLTSAAPTPAPVIRVGSKVKVKRGAKTYTGGKLANFVYNTVYEVQQVNGNRVVIGLKGQVTAAVKLQDLILQ
jgi:hypothetical protein